MIFLKFILLDRVSFPTSLLDVMPGLAPTHTRTLKCTQRALVPFIRIPATPPLTFHTHPQAWREALTDPYSARSHARAHAGAHTTRTHGGISFFSFLFMSLAGITRGIDCRVYLL